MKPTILKNTILKLFRKGYSKNLRGLMDRVHPADLALVFPTLQDPDKKVFFDQIIDDRHAAQILSEMSDKKLVVKILNGLNNKRISEIFHHMDPDDAADILGNLPTRDSEAILRLMQKEDAAEVNKLLMYEPDTAGGLMTPHFLAMTSDSTAEDVLKKLRKTKNMELIVYIYVVDREGRLLGHVPLNQLMLLPEDTKLSKAVEKDVYPVRHRISADEVLRIFNKYHLLEMPVVDKDNRLLGIITYDDVMDVMSNETTNRLLRNAGSGAVDDPASAPLWAYMKKRFWWTLLCFMGGIGSAAMIQGIAWPQTVDVSYLSMLPLVVIISIIASTQTSSFVERALFIGKLDGIPGKKVLYKELKLALIMGLIFGIMTGSFNYASNYMISRDPKTSIIVTAGILLVFPVSALIGFIMPLLMTRIRKTPSGAAMPFTATLSTLANSFLYLLISTKLDALDIIIRI